MLLVAVPLVQVALPPLPRHLGGLFPALQWVSPRPAQPGCAHPHLGFDLRPLRTKACPSSPGSRCSRRPHCFCGLAQSISMLIWSRALPRRRRRAMFATGLASSPRISGSGAWQGASRRGAPPWAARSAIGPLVGGLLTSGIAGAGLHRHVPIGAVAIWLSSTKMRNPEGPPARLRLDGLRPRQFLSAGMFLLELGLIRGNSLGWSSGANCRDVLRFRVGLCRLRLHRTPPDRPNVRLPLALSQTQLQRRLARHLRRRRRNVRTDAVFSLCICRTTSVTLRSARAAPLADDDSSPCRPFIFARLSAHSAWRRAGGGIPYLPLASLRCSRWAPSAGRSSSGAAALGWHRHCHPRHRAASVSASSPP